MDDKMKINLYTIDGKIKGEIELPSVFSTSFRPDIIKKAVEASRANRRQPYGASPDSGKRHSVEGIGKGHGSSRVPRIKDSRRGGLAPNVVGGRPAHPPKPYKNWKEKINKKEKRIALLSALAATCNSKLISSRGHRFTEGITLPIVVEDGFENLKTRDVVQFLIKVGIYQDIERAEKGTKIRAGKGKMRGRRRKEPKSILIVTSKRFRADNLPGVDVATPDQLNTELLAPGGAAGRLALFTESALKSIGGW